MFVKTFRCIAQQQLHALLFQVRLQRLDHFAVPRWQDLIGQLDNGHLQTALCEIFGDFNANEAGSHNHGALGTAGHDVIQPVGIFQIPQLVDQRAFDAGNRRAKRRGARGQNQLVVRFGAFCAGFVRKYCHGLVGSVDGRDFRAGLHV